ncbi:MAG TPA: ATP-binding protein [Bacteroidota bacterium]|nr:ATP-binding protein [Bacteroidota bacterium]
MKKYSRYIIIFLIFCAIEAIVIIFYSNRTTNELDKYLNNVENAYKNIYQSSLNNANNSANNFYYYYIKKNNIIELFKNAYDNNSMQRHIIRNQLYKIINNDISPSKNSNIIGVNFIFPDNTVFLRSDKPSLYGDNISYRSIIALAKQNKQIYSGFDFGLAEVCYRYVIPIEEKGNYYGIIEIKLRLHYFFNNFNSLPNTRTFSVIQKVISDNILHPDLKYNYLQISNKYNFVLDSLSYNEFNQLNKIFQNDGSKSLADDINLLINESETTINNPKKSIRKSGEDYYILSEIPIRSFSGIKLGGFIIVNKNYIIADIIENNNYHLIIISVIILSFFVLYLFRYNYSRKIKQNMDELQKSRNKLSQTLKELQKSQSELQEKQDFTAKINSLLREHEKELEHLLIEKDKFFSILSHDIKNPIGGILTDSETLSHYYDKMSDKDRKEFINRIVTTTQNLNKIVRDMLDWGMVKLNRLEVQEERILPLEILYKVRSQLIKSAEEKGDQIIIECPSELEITSDPDLLTIVFRNIIQNSIKFTENGRIEIECFTKDSDVIFNFKDTGIGIAYENLEKIFKLDKTVTTIGTKGEVGTGLGLLLVKDYVTKLGGEISINSMEGKGTTVTIILKNKIENK